MSHQLDNAAFETAYASIRLDTRGNGRPILILHGGGGPRTVAGLAQALATEGRVLSPTHPGFDGTSRPAELAAIADLAAFYVQMLWSLNLNGVLVVGSSIGGWIASEMALLPDNRTAGLVLIDAVGIAVEGEDVADVFTLSPLNMMERVFHAPDRTRAIAPLPSEMQKAVDVANLATLAVYDDRNAMQDPTLRARLSSIRCPTLVLWGESDRVVSTAYGRAYAAAISDARFQIVLEAGHLPQVEQPVPTIGLIHNFLLEIGEPSAT